MSPRMISSQQRRDRPRLSLVAPALLALTVMACSGAETGTPWVTFQVAGAGPEGAAGALLFQTQQGYEVELHRAALRVGALYVNRQVPLPGVGSQPCVLPGTYVAESTSGAVIDVLDGRPQPFPTAGVGLQDRGRTGELWLKGDEVAVDAESDGAVVLEARGTARRNEAEWPFETQITIGQNRRVPDPDQRRPGANPICRARIISPIPVDLEPSEGGRLLVRIHPELWFDRVEFAALREEDRASDASRSYRIPDTLEGQPAMNLWSGIRRGSAYHMEFDSVR